MQLAALETRIDELVSDLDCYSGYRSLWLDPQGRIVHSEPEEMLELRGFRYITTLMQPDREELTAAILMAVPVELDEPVRQALSGWQAPAWAEPAMA